MSQEDARLTIENLERQIKEMKRQMGIRPAAEQPTKAPDGGAPSTFHMRAKAVHQKVMRVRLKKVDGNEEAFINPAYFNEKLHEQLDPATPRVRRVIDRDSEEGEPVKAPKKEVITTNLTKQQLLTMALGVLRTQPELVTGMDEKDIPDKKSDIVEAIMAVRDRVAAAAE